MLLALRGIKDSTPLNMLSTFPDVHRDYVDIFL